MVRLTDDGEAKVWSVDPIPENKPFDEKWDDEITVSGASMTPESSQQYRLRAYDQNETQVGVLDFEVREIE